MLPIALFGDDLPLEPFLEDVRQLCDPKGKIRDRERVDIAVRLLNQLDSGKRVADGYCSELKSVRHSRLDFSFSLEWIPLRLRVHRHLCRDGNVPPEMWGPSRDLRSVPSRYFEV